jgi:hypothetical protein
MKSALTALALLLALSGEASATWSANQSQGSGRAVGSQGIIYYFGGRYDPGTTFMMPRLGERPLSSTNAFGGGPYEPGTRFPMPPQMPTAWGVFSTPGQNVGGNPGGGYSGGYNPGHTSSSEKAH